MLVSLAVSNKQISAIRLQLPRVNKKLSYACAVNFGCNETSSVFYEALALCPPWKSSALTSGSCHLRVCTGSLAEGQQHWQHLYVDLGEHLSWFCLSTSPTLLLSHDQILGSVFGSAIYSLPASSSLRASVFPSVKWGYKWLFMIQEHSDNRHNPAGCQAIPRKWNLVCTY